MNIEQRVIEVLEEFNYGKVLVSQDTGKHLVRMEDVVEIVQEVIERNQERQAFIDESARGLHRDFMKQLINGNKPNYGGTASQYAYNEAEELYNERQSRIGN